MQSIITNSAAETEKFAQELAGKLKGNDVLAFFGGLGMGKTTFVRGLARGLGSSDEVSSPTFALVHEYRSTPKLYHFDMYGLLLSMTYTLPDFLIIWKPVRSWPSNGVKTSSGHCLKIPFG